MNELKPLVFDTPDKIEFFVLCSMRGRLQLELKGLRFRTSTLKHLNHRFNQHFTRRAQGLAWVEEEISRRSQQITQDPL